MPAGKNTLFPGLKAVEVHNQIWKRDINNLISGAGG